MIQINRRVHMIESMWMDGPPWVRKVKDFTAKMGNLVKPLESGVKLGALAEAVET